MINEYLLMVNDEMFRVYAPNEKIAINTFCGTCEKYANTNNEDFRHYWNDLKDNIKHGSYQIIHNNDFTGVRRI